MSGENLTPELARLIRRLEARIHALEAYVAPVGARSLNDLDDVYINVLARSDGDVVTWVEANQDWESLPGGGGTNYWEFAFDDLHLDPTTTAGIESISVDVADAVTGGAITLYTERGSSFAVVGTVVNATSSYSFIEANDGSDDCYVVAEASGTFYTQTTVHHRAKQHLWTEALAAIADGELDVSEFSIWLDDTPGSASLNIKAKDSAGTVVTGSISLT